MNKQCKACGSNVPSDAKFCHVCGCSDFIINNQDSNQSVYNQSQYNQQPTGNQFWQQPIPKNTPSRKRIVLIGIVAVVLIVLAGIGIVAEKMFQEQGHGDNIDNNNDYSYNVDDSTNYGSEEEPDKLYYSKGLFNGSVYINEWADIKFALPEGFSNADQETYNSAETSNTECGVYYMADDTMSLIYISFEKLPTFPIYDEEAYLDTAMKSLESISGITYRIPDTYSTATIGGYTYTTAECEFNNGKGDFSNTFYVRKLDNYMICISAISINPESNDALVSNITTVR